MNFIRVCDIETTGDDPLKDEVIEAGWVDIYPDGTMTAPEQVFVRPNATISVEAMAVHHLREDDVMDGVDPLVLRDILMSGSPVAFVAHNAKFEESFMPWLKTNWICTYKCALRIWPYAPKHSNQVLRYWLGLELDEALAMPPHRAAPDAYTTAHIFARMLAHEGEHRLKRLLAWSREPGLLPSVRFGKHKGSSWQDVPGDYLTWLIEKSEMDEDVKFTAWKESIRRQFPEEQAA